VRPTPEEIEARRFRLAQNGYDCEAVDRFLAEIAEGLRSDPAPDPLDPDEFGRLGQEIAAILRNAHDGAGAVRAEAEGHAAALRATAEAEAHDIRKASQGEAEAIKALATIEADAERNAAKTDVEALLAKAQSEAAEIRVEAERQLEQAAQALALAGEQAAEIRAGADREVAGKLERAERDARQRASDIVVDADRRVGAAREAERSTHQRLAAARDELQQVIERLAAPDFGQHDNPVVPVVDLTTAPARVRPLASPTGGDASATTAATGDPTAQPASAEADVETSPATPSAAFDIAGSSVSSSELEPPAAASAGDPLLRMVRAAVGRAVEASVEATGHGEHPEDASREASAS